MKSKGFRSIFVHTVPVLAGYVFLGIAFGLLMRTKGYPVWLPVMMSLVIYSGALEFAAIPLLAQPFDPIGSFLLGIMISARHLFYGIPMLNRYHDTGKLKAPLIFALTDETFSILSTIEPPEGVKPIRFYTGVSFLDYFYWNLGTFIGSAVGGVISFNVEGLDFALTALFIVLFIEQLKNRTGLISGFTGLIASAAVLLLFGSANMVVLSMLAIAVLLVAGRRVIEHA